MKDDRLSIRHHLCAALLGSMVSSLLAIPSLAQNPMAAQAQANAIGARLLDDGKMHVVLCGTAGPIYSPTRSGPCTAVIADGHFFLVDAGSGAARSLARLALPVGELDGLLLTHFHSDHIDDLAEVNFAHWTRSDGLTPLDIWGSSPPIGVVVHGFDNAYVPDVGYREAHHGRDIMPPQGATAEPHEIVFAGEETRKTIYERDGFTVTAFLVDHPPIPQALGYRFDWNGLSVVVSGDTRRSTNLVAAARGADLLVHEAIADSVIRMIAPMLEGAGNARGATILTDALTNHTFPSDVYAVAAEAEVEALVLSHLVPALPASQAAGPFGQGSDIFEGQSWVGEDGMHFVLDPQGGTLTLETLAGLGGTP